MAVVSTVSVAPLLTLTVSVEFGRPPAPDPPVKALQFLVPEAVTVAACSEAGTSIQPTSASNVSMTRYRRVCIGIFVVTEAGGVFGFITIWMVG